MSARLFAKKLICNINEDADENETYRGFERD